MRLAITLSFLNIWLCWCSWKTSKTNVSFRRSIKSTLSFTEVLKAIEYLVCEMETLFIGSTFWLNYEQLEDSNLQNKLFSIRQFVAGIKIKLGIYTWQFHLRLLFPREHKALKRIPIETCNWIVEGLRQRLDLFKTEFLGRKFDQLLNTKNYGGSFCNSLCSLYML